MIMDIKEIKFQSEIRHMLNQWVRDHMNGAKWTTKVCAEINGKIMYLTEYEVRYLQVLCGEYCTTDKKFQEWCESIVIYNGRFKHNSKPMEWCQDGTFSTKFMSGFYDTAGFLWARVLQHAHKLNKK